VPNEGFRTPCARPSRKLRKGERIVCRLRAVHQRARDQVLGASKRVQAYDAPLAAATCLTASNQAWCVPLKRWANRRECLALRGFPTNFDCTHFRTQEQFMDAIGNAMSVNVLEALLCSLFGLEYLPRSGPYTTSPASTHVALKRLLERENESCPVLEKVARLYVEVHDPEGVPVDDEVLLLTP